MNIRLASLFLACITLFGCTMNTTKSDTAKHALTKSSLPGKYSLYGKSMQHDKESGLMYIDVYVGGGGDRDGAMVFAKDEMTKYSDAHGFSSYEIVKSEYAFFPLSKYTFYVQYKQ